MNESFRVVPIPAFNDNYIWSLERGGMAAIVDPGDAAPVIAYLDAQGLSLAAILVTHHHPDHIGGIPAILAKRPVPVYGPSKEDIGAVTVTVQEGDRVELRELGATFRVIEVPGHTKGHIAYVADGMLFCGDTLFACGCGRNFEGSPAQLHASLLRLSALPGETMIYCAHEYTLSNIRFATHVDPGNERLAQRAIQESARRSRGEPTVPSSIAVELATNPFLRCDDPAIVRAARERSGQRPDSAAGVFAVLREWKNSF